MFNGGMLAIELPAREIKKIFEKYGKSGASVKIDLDKFVLTVEGGGSQDAFPFKLDPFDAELVKAGGWLEYADKKY